MKRTPRSILLAASMTGQAVDLASEHFCCVSLESLLLGRARGIGADFGKYKGDNFVMTSQTQFRQLTCASFFVVAALKIRDDGRAQGLKWHAAAFTLITGSWNSHMPQNSLKE